MRGKRHGEMQMIGLIMAHEPGDRVDLYAMIINGTWIYTVGKLHNRT